MKVVVGAAGVVPDVEALLGDDRLAESGEEGSERVWRWRRRGRLPRWVRVWRRRERRTRRMLGGSEPGDEHERKVVRRELARIRVPKRNNCQLRSYPRHRAEPYMVAPRTGRKVEVKVGTKETNSLRSALPTRHSVDYCLRPDSLLSHHPPPCSHSLLLAPSSSSPTLGPRAPQHNTLRSMTCVSQPALQPETSAPQFLARPTRCLVPTLRHLIPPAPTSNRRRKQRRGGGGEHEGARAGRGQQG